MEEEGGGGHENSERWLVSYADFITLLFALFVLLFALSTESHSRRSKLWREVSESVGVRPGMGSGRPSLDPTYEGSKPGVDDLAQRQLSETRRALAQSVGQSPDSGITMKIDGRGLVISLAAKSFFDSGEAEIHPDQFAALDKMITVIGRLPNPIRVEGFTDSVPISNQRYADNWDLSVARAGNVLRYIQQHSWLPPEQLSLAGYGPYRPAASNDTEEGRSLNRRVDIVIEPLRPSAIAAAAAEARDAP